MPVPLFDTRTPLAPLREAIAARMADVVEGGRFILGSEVQAVPMSPVRSAEQAAEDVAAVRDAGLGRPH